MYGTDGQMSAPRPFRSAFLAALPARNPLSTPPPPHRCPPRRAGRRTTTVRVPIVTNGAYLIPTLPHQPRTLSIARRLQMTSMARRGSTALT